MILVLAISLVLFIYAIAALVSTRNHKKSEEITEKILQRKYPSSVYRSTSSTTTKSTSRQPNWNDDSYIYSHHTTHDCSSHSHSDHSSDGCDFGGHDGGDCGGGDD